jgi:hypothetical protein
LKTMVAKDDLLILPILLSSSPSMPIFGNHGVFTIRTSLIPIRRGFTPGFVNYKRGALDSPPQVIKLTNCLPMVGGSLRLPPPLKLAAMI